MASELVLLVSIILLTQAEILFAQLNKIRGCLFESSSRLRTNKAAFTVRDIDFTLCSHYIYSSAKVDVSGLTIEPADPSDEEGTTGLYKQFNDGKKKFEGIKTILSVGGTGGAHDAAFESLHKTDATFEGFAQNAVKYVKDQGFDGINIHWEMAIHESGKKVLPKLLRALKNVIDPDKPLKLLLTMTGNPNPLGVQLMYDVPELNKLVDYVFLNSKHLRTTGSPRTTFIAPVNENAGIPGGILSLNSSIQYLHYYGMSFNKMVIGIVIPGNYVKLKDRTKFHPGSDASECLRGHIYNMDCMLAYPEICALMGTSQRYFDNIQKTAYLVHEDEWVGYVDKASLDARIWLMRAFGLAGVYFMNLDEDDFSGNACNDGTFPLITYLRYKLIPVRPTETSTETTVMISTTTTTGKQTTTTSGLTTTKARSAPTTTKKRVPGRKVKKANSFTVISYIMLTCLFIIGHVLGHLFMRFTRQTLELYKQL